MKLTVHTRAKNIWREGNPSSLLCASLPPLSPSKITTDKKEGETRGVESRLLSSVSLSFRSQSQALTRVLWGCRAESETEGAECRRRGAQQIGIGDRSNWSGAGGLQMAHGWMATSRAAWTGRFTSIFSCNFFHP